MSQWDEWDECGSVKKSKILREAAKSLIDNMSDDQIKQLLRSLICDVTEKKINSTQNSLWQGR